ncbi:MAG: hypothetical protein QOE77_501 [Blastocatellia bacterium]|jgi:hypothetical protein|nr:hypothetical protein [Blastocatellia bacterium]
MIRFLILACIVATTCAARPVAACTCPDLGSLADEYHHSSAVFVGRIVSIEIYSEIIGGEKIEHMIATFAVERRWKGPTLARLRVQTCGTQALVCTCGFNFQLGERYVVFAAGKPLKTSSCNRNVILPQLPRGEATKIRAAGGVLPGDDLLKDLDAIAKRK